MGLNDDVDEGLQPEDTADFNPDLPVPKPIVIQPDDSSLETNPEVTQEDLFGIGALKNEIPNLNAQFILTEEQCNKTMDLIDIRNTLAKSNGVCREDAELIDAVVPGFVNDKKPLGFFTDNKSKTQFGETIVSLNKAIDTNLAVITGQAKDSATASCSKFLPLIKELPVKVTEVTASLQNEMMKLFDFVTSEGMNEGFTFSDSSTIKDVLYKIPHVDTEHCEAAVRDAIIEIAKFKEGRANDKNMKALFLHLLDEGNEKVIFAAGHSYSLYELTDKVPFLISVDTETSDKLEINLSIYEYMTCSIDGSTIESIKRLLGACSNIMSTVGSSVEKIVSISAEETNDYDSKLNRIVAINGANTKDTLFVFSVLSFINEYVVFLGKLKDLLKVLESKLK